MELATRQEHDGSVRIVCRGELDYASADQFLRTVTGVQAGQVVIDFGEVEFVDSTGVAALCRAIEHVRDRQGVVKVVNVHEGIYEILVLVGCVEAFGADTFTVVKDERGPGPGA